MSDSTRDKIIETVMRLYSQYSYEEISTKQIIKEVGNSKGSLYWHFAKKEDIFNEVFEHCYKKTLEYARMGIDDDASVIYSLKRRLKNLTALNKIDPYCIPVFGKHIPVITKQKDSSLYGEFRNDIVKLVKKGLRSKEMADFPESFLVNTIFRMADEFLKYLSEHPEYYKNEALIDRMISNLYKSIQP